MSEKTKADILKEELFYSPSNAFAVCNEKEIDRAQKFCAGYIDFLNACRTEREVNAYVKEQAVKKGYSEFDRSLKYKAGDKVYFDIHGKALILTTFGKKSVKFGTRIVAAHIDSPRLDLKPNPLYEDEELGYFKTHYYGGIKKYQWPTVPLALHGVICKRDGTSVTVKIGDADGDPRFVITDLLPHLDREDRSIRKAVAGEDLNILIGSRPFGNEKGDKLVKLNLLRLLNEKYGIKEEDFLTAELEAVPAYPAVDIGFDRSLIGSYGHDDRVCAYPAVMAEFDIKKPEYTTVTVITDKEETGSDGNTGLHSSFLKQYICDLAEHAGVPGRDILRASKCLSADVNAGYDPTFSSAFEKNNSAYLNKGIVVTKYTGSGGKGSTNDANAEYVAEVAAIFDKSGTVWQTGELGKIDIGGGGTVAKYVANLGVNVVDVGVPVLSMHAPFEVVAKMDVYMAYKGFKAFAESK